MKGSGDASDAAWAAAAHDDGTVAGDRNELWARLDDEDKQLAPMQDHKHRKQQIYGEKVAADPHDHDQALQAWKEAALKTRAR